MMAKERGFTLVELMVVLAIFSFIMAGVIGLYVSAVRFTTFMKAKTSILNSVSIIYDAYRPYFYGATVVYDPNNVELGELFDSNNPRDMDSVMFYTKMKDENDMPIDAWVLIVPKTTGYYVKKDVGGSVSCVPQTRVLFVRRVFEDGFDHSTVVPTLSDWQSWISSGLAQVYEVKPAVGGINGLSEVQIKYDPYAIGGTGYTMKWRDLKIVLTIGVRDEIYSDSSCTNVVSKYPVSLYPYTVVFSITSVNR